jgi:hypothetical protein
MLRWLLAAALLPLAFGQPQSKWTLQYFYDQEGKVLEITDLAFPSATRGIAVGAIVDREGRRPQFTALVTSDGGSHWALVPLKEYPRSLFFLDEMNGWMVTGEGLWFTREAGRSWIRIADQIKPNKKLADAPRGGLILRVWFLDEQHGYAVGLQKSALETHDGGRTWTPLEEAAKPTSDPAFTVYSHIAFADARRGLVLGSYLPPSARQDLGYDLPQQTLSRRQVPRLMIEMDTRDSGEVWKSGTAPLLGSVNSLRVAGSSGLAVFNYLDSFAWPAEVYRIDLATGQSESVFKQKDRRVTDTAIFADGRAFLAAVEPPGKLRSAPIPGRIRMLESDDLKNWREMPVDYRAVAQSLVLAGPDPDHLWAATDTGMILRLSAAH